MVQAQLNVEGRLGREVEMWKDELIALSRVFLPSEHNTPSKSIGTTVLFVVWAIIYVGIGAGYLEMRPPFFMEFTILVFIIVARWWGIESVWQSVSNIDAALDAIEEYERMQDEDDDG